MPIHVDPDQIGIMPEGVHRLTIDTIEQRISSSGNPMLVVDMSNPHGKTVTDWIVLRADLIEWKFRPLWEAAGLTWPQSATELDERELVDKTITATIIHQRRDGFTNARVENYHPPGAPQSDLPGQESFGLEPARVAAPANAIDDDIPF